MPKAVSISAGRFAFVDCRLDADAGTESAGRFTI
jgi:hypothetical protein